MKVRPRLPHSSVDAGPHLGGRSGVPPSPNLNTDRIKTPLRPRPVYAAGRCSGRLHGHRKDDTMVRGPHENNEWVDVRLHAAFRRLRAMMIGNMSGETLPAAQQAWKEATEMVTQVMQEHGIAFDEPGPGTSEITPAVVDRLLDEAELSPGPMTPATRAMLAILRRLHTSGGPAPQFDEWSSRALALFDQRITDPPPRPDAPPPAPDHPIRRD